MTRRLFNPRVWLAIVVVSMVLFGGLLAWLLGTQSGATFSVRYALEKSGLNATMGHLDGTLAKGIVATDIDARFGSEQLTIGRIDLTLVLSDLWRRTVTIERLYVSDVVWQRGAATGETPVDHPPLELPDAIDLPVDILANELEFRHIEYRAVDGEQLVTIATLNGRAALRGRQLTLESLSTQTSIGDAEGKATMALAKPYPVSATLDTQLSLPERPVLESHSTVDGTLESLTVQHTTLAPYGIRVSGTLEPLESPPQVNFRVEVDDPRLDTLFNIDDLADSKPTGELLVEGPLDELLIRSTLSGQLPSLGRATVDWAAVLTPTAFTLSESTLVVFHDERQTTMRSTGRLQFADAAPVLRLDTTVDTFSWPWVGEPAITARNSEVLLSGTLNQYRLEAQGIIDSRVDQGGQYELTATGSAEQFTLEKLTLNALEGALSATGQMTFAPAWQFQAHLKGDGLNPAGLDAKWPGNVSLEASVRGDQRDQVPSLTIDTLTANGTLRNYPLSLRAEAEVEGSRLDIEALELNSGESTLSAQGVVNQVLDVSWNINSDDLTSLWPGLNGQIRADGQLAGTLTQPQIDATLNGQGLAFGDFRVGDVSAGIKTAPTSESAMSPGLTSTTTQILSQEPLTQALGSVTASVEFVLNDLELGQYKATALTVDASGGLEGHTLSFVLNDQLGQTSLRAKGSLVSDAYALTLQALDFEAEQLGRWQLAQPVTAQVDADRLEFPLMCVGQDTSSLCIELQSAVQSLNTKLQVSDVPLSLLAHWLPTGVNAVGLVDGGGELVLASQERSQGALNFSIDDLALQSRYRSEASVSTLAFNSSTVSARVDDSGVLVADATFPLASGGGITVSATLASGGDVLLERPLQGQADVAIPSVAFLADYLPELGRIDGRVDGSVEVLGTLRRPQLVGSLALKDGAMTLTRPGLEVQKVNVVLRGEDDNRFSIEGTAQSGEGAVTLKGDAQHTDTGLRADLNLTGDNVQVLNTTESQVWAAPNVRAVLDNRELSLTGSVSVPKAYVQVDALPEGVVNVSPDQIIIGEAPLDEDSVLSYDIDLDLELGEDVRLKAFGLDARLVGALNVKEYSDKPGSASGEIQLKDGEYEAYGQTLTITTGKLLYAGGALDKPGIDFRAVRNPTPDIEVGISARGTLDEPGFSVFSTPSMSESDQLAYLVLGRPLNAEATSENALITRLALSLGMQGGEALSQKLATELGVDQIAIESQRSGDLSQASLVIGKFLSPKLFVSYGIGLLEPISTLKLEYALSSKWQLITESSTTRNSADAQYTFER